MKSMFFYVLGFDGLFWPSLAFLVFLGLDEFFKQRPAFGDENKAKLSCFQNQMSKPNSESKSPIYSTVMRRCQKMPKFDF